MPIVNTDPQFDDAIQSIAYSVFEEDFLIGIHELLYARHLVFLDSYSYDGALLSRSAVLLNGLCHITVNVDYDCDFILSLGALPFIEEGGVYDWRVLSEKIDMLAESCLDEWEERMEGETLFNENFTCFSLDKLIYAAESEEREEIQPILSTFMEVFPHYFDVFTEYADQDLNSHFDSDVITDETLEAAFIAFITFIKEKVLPKLTQTLLHGVPNNTKPI